MGQTKREAALAHLANAPLDMEISVPEKATKRTHPEAQLHAACAAYLRLREKRGDLLFHSNLSEGKRDPKRAGWFKAMSGRPGHPDITVYMRTGTVPTTCFIELKAEKGRLSDAQQDWCDRLTDAGYQYFVVRSVDHLARLFP